MMSPHRVLAAAAALSLSVALVGLAAPAHAGFGFKIKGPSIKTPNAGKRLREADDLFRAGIKALPGKFGYDLAKEQAGIDEALAKYKAGKDKLSADLKLASGFDQVKKRREALRVGIGQSRAMLECGKAWAKIRAIHKTGKAAPNPALDALDKAVAAFAKGAPSNYAKPVKWWQDEAKRLRTRNPEIAREAKAKADAEAKAAKERAEREARRALEEKKRTAFAGINALMGELDKMIKEPTEPIPAAKLADFDKGIETVRAVHEPSTELYNYNRHHYALYNALVAGANMPAEVAKALGGTVAASGQSKGKVLSISLKAAPDTCYLAVMRWKSWSGGERYKGAKWHPKKGASAMQLFWPHVFPKWQRVAGFCTTGPAAATYGGDLEFAGTKNGVDYVVVQWARAKVPTWLMAYKRVGIYDQCDVTAWDNLWRHPLPGTIVWKDKEPFLVTTARFNGSWLDAWSVTGGRERRIQMGSVTSAVPTARAIATKLSVPRCRGDEGAPKAAVAYVKCNRKLDDKYGKLYDKWGAKKKYAKSISGYRKAQKTLDKLPGKERDERAKKCGKIRKKIEAGWGKMFNALVDHIVDEGVKDSLDVPTYWKRVRGE